MTEPDRPTDARSRLLSHFSVDTTLHPQKWDDLYAENFLPWDKGFPNPALVDLLSERSDNLLPRPSEGKKLLALVPGCGKGYDVLLLKAFGYEAYGLESSKRALEGARKVEREMGGEEVYRDRGGGEGSVKWIEGNFFEDGFLEGVEGEGKFDLIYDYTVCSCSVFRPFKDV
jgi:SAM-dependent methyltransferase